MSSMLSQYLLQREIYHSFSMLDEAEVQIEKAKVHQASIDKALLCCCKSVNFILIEKDKL